MIWNDAYSYLIGPRLLGSGNLPSLSDTTVAAIIAATATIVVAVIGLFSTRNNDDHRNEDRHERAELQAKIDKLERENDTLWGRIRRGREAMIRNGINPDTGKPFRDHDERRGTAT